VAGAGPIDLVIMGIGQVCWLDCKLELGTGASWEELSVIGAVVKWGIYWDVCQSSVDCCMLVWIEYG